MAWHGLATGEHRHPVSHPARPAIAATSPALQAWHCSHRLRVQVNTGGHGLQGLQLVNTGGISSGQVTQSVTHQPPATAPDLLAAALASAA